MSQREHGHIGRVAITAGLTAVLSLTSLPIAQVALADTASQKSELQARIESSAKAYDDASKKVSELEAKISDSQQTIDQVQADLPAQKDRAADALRTLYKMHQGTPGLLELLLSAEDFNEFITNYQYMSVIENRNVEEAQRLADMEQQLLGAQQTLSSAKDEAQRQQQQASTALSDAQSDTTVT